MDIESREFENVGNSLAVFLEIMVATVAGVMLIMKWKGCARI